MTSLVPVAVPRFNLYGETGTWAPPNKRLVGAYWKCANRQPAGGDL